MNYMSFASTSDVFFIQNAVDLAKDMLTAWLVNSVWIPRGCNSICDALAKKASESSSFSI
jgi:hypothetical protein